MCSLPAGSRGCLSPCEKESPSRDAGGLGEVEASAAPSVGDAARPCGPFPWRHQGVQKRCWGGHLPARPGMKPCGSWVERQNPSAANTPLSGSRFPERCSRARQASLGSALPARHWRCAGGAGEYPDPTRGGTMLIPAADSAAPV